MNILQITVVVVILVILCSAQSNDVEITPSSQVEATSTATGNPEESTDQQPGLSEKGHKVWPIKMYPPPKPIKMDPKPEPSLEEQRPEPSISANVADESTDVRNTSTPSTNDALVAQSLNNTTDLHGTPKPDKEWDWDTDREDPIYVNNYDAEEAGPGAIPLNKTKEQLMKEVEKSWRKELGKLKDEISKTYRFLINKTPCNYTLYKQVMPAFWQAFRVGTRSQQEAEAFGNTFWNISVEYDDEEAFTTVRGKCDPSGKVTSCFIKRKEQEQREKDLCFTGGLMGCSKKTQTCTCLNEPGMRTIRVNLDTGKPDDNGTTCFVTTGEQCLYSHYGIKNLVFPCVHNDLCSSYSQDCVEEDGDERRRNRKLYVDV